MFDCVLFYGNHGQQTLRYAGVDRIATELRSNGYSVITIDLCCFDTNSIRLIELLDIVVGKNTLWCGIGTTFLFNVFGIPFKTISKDSQTDNTLIKQFVDKCQTINPNIKFIAGGSRYFPLEKYGFKIFEGYVDKQIIEFTDWCAKKKPAADLNFYSSKIIGSEYENFSTSQIVYQKEDCLTTTDVLPIEISRGCIFKCKFCSYPLNGKKKGDFIKHTDVLKDELIKNYEMFGITNYTFSDDTYNDSIDKIKILHDEVFSKLPFKLSFTAYLRLDLMMRFPESAEVLVESGLKSCSFGIETINFKSAKSIGKGVDPFEQFEYIRLLKESQFKKVLTQSGFILGLPHDTRDTIFELEEFLRSDNNKLDHWNITPLWINPPLINKNKKFYSEFDLEYEKYGYKIITNEHKSAKQEIGWINEITGLDFDFCFHHAERIEKESQLLKKFKVGGFLYPFWKTLGISDEDMLTYSMSELRLKYRILKLIELRKNQYRDNLFKVLKNDLD